MNLTQLKNYAPAARNALITAVTRRAAVLGIQPGRVEAVTESGDVALIGGQPFPRSIVPLRKQLVEIIQRNGFAATMEAMAYTWFNRLVAIRFMELHDGWLSHGYRVLSHPDGHSLPEIIQHAEHLDLKSLDREEVIRLKLAGNRDEELYRILLLAQCAELNRILPDVFSRLDDATILLLPDNLLHSDSLVRQLVANSSEDDWKEVEVLGWLYQFYISEKKDAVMARKSAVPTEDIPAVTQLFTPHWIVRYLVENSLGRLWLLNRPNSRLREHMPYYIEGEAETDFLKITKPEEIRLVDPAVGSGHMLTYAFDLLVLIYEEEGYAPNDIPGLILKHNLHGLDLCPRAAQLAELALVFKAREKSRRFFQPDHLVRPNITELKDVRFDDGELQAYFKALGCQPSSLHAQLTTLLHQFEEAKNFGSLILPCLSEAEVQSVRSAIQNSEANIQHSDLMVGATHLKVLRVLEQAEALTQRYHVVVANPPYMGSKAFTPTLKRFVETYYKAAKGDLYSCFISRNAHLAINGGAVGMITIPNWMFLSSFADLRKALLGTVGISSLAHLGRGVWGSDFGSCAFTMVKGQKSDRPGVFLRLFDQPGEVNSNEVLSARFLNRDDYPAYVCRPEDFSSIEGAPLAYWIPEALRNTFRSSPKLGSIGVGKHGMSTSDNARFIRLWHEVSSGNSSYSCRSRQEAVSSEKKWFPFNKGGTGRRWYGNQDFVVNWFNDGHEIKKVTDEKYPYLNGNLGFVIGGEEYYFRDGLTWSSIGIASPSFRYLPEGFIICNKGQTFYTTDPEQSKLALAFLNSIASCYALQALSPTVGFELGYVLNLPMVFPAAFDTQTIDQTVGLARADWDNFETSWDFRDLPLLRIELKGTTLEASWRNWEAQSTAAIRRMQELETENNRLFIAAYGLEGELEPEVPEEQITLARAEARRDMAAFLSYAVGCMMGRYSLDAPGLICANAGDTVEDYLRIVAEKRASNPNGIASSSPGLLGTSYPGSDAPPEPNPNGVASGSPPPAGHNPVGVGSISVIDSQGSASRATLGSGTESLWDTESGIRNSKFPPDEDGIIPVLDGEWFDDDIVARTKEFLRVTFGEATLEENLRFIQNALGKDLRSYFLTDFYKDHLQTYKNRPIYWLFSSGKQRAFQCLVYLHRYQEGTLARIRTEYVIPLQGKLAAAISRLEEEIPKTSSSSARKKLQTELDKAKKQMAELLAYDEQLRSYADQRIALDLDDGVKVNYARFGPLVAEAKKICGTKED